MSINVTKKIKTDSSMEMVWWYKLSGSSMLFMYLGLPSKWNELEFEPQYHKKKKIPLELTVWGLLFHTFYDKMHFFAEKKKS
jgi:hypothetical protein